MLLLPGPFPEVSANLTQTWAQLREQLLATLHAYPAVLAMPLPTLFDASAAARCLTGAI